MDFLTDSWVGFVCGLVETILGVWFGWWLGKYEDASKVKKSVLGILVVIALTGLFGGYVVFGQRTLSEKVDTLTNAVNELTGIISDKDTQIEELTIENEKLGGSRTKESTQEKVPLTSLHYISERHFEVSEASRKDMFGNLYGTGHMVISAEGAESYGKVDFYLNQQFRILSDLVIAISEDSYTNEDFMLTGWLGIYDKETGRELYKSPKLSVFTEPIHAPGIDVKGVKWLEIRYYDLDNQWSMATDFVTLQIIMDGAKLQ